MIAEVRSLGFLPSKERGILEEIEEKDQKEERKGKEGKKREGLGREESHRG